MSDEECYFFMQNISLTDLFPASSLRLYVDRCPSSLLHFSRTYRMSRINTYVLSFFTNYYLFSDASYILFA